MRYLVLVLMLLPVPANAEAFTKADCDFLGLYYATCETEGNSLPYMGRDEAGSCPVILPLPNGATASCIKAWRERTRNITGIAGANPNIWRTDRCRSTANARIQEEVMLKIFLVYYAASGGIAGVDGPYSNMKKCEYDANTMRIGEMITTSR